MISKDFIEYYKSVSVSELLIILEKPGDYQPEALAAAKRELENRNLSSTELDEAKQINENDLLQKKVQREKFKVVENKIKKTGYSFFDMINPMQTGLPTVEKTIRFIVAGYLIVFMIDLLSEFKVIKVMISEIADAPVETGFYLLPYILLAVGLYFFWKKKKKGWVFFAIFISYAITGAAYMVYFYFTWTSSGNDLAIINFPRPSIITYLIQLLVLGLTLYRICKPDIRNIYKIDKQSMFLCIIPVVLFVLFFFFISTLY